MLPIVHGPPPIGATPISRYLPSSRPCSTHDHMWIGGIPKDAYFAPMMTTFSEAVLIGPFKPHARPSEIVVVWCMSQLFLNQYAFSAQRNWFCASMCDAWWHDTLCECISRGKSSVCWKVLRLSTMSQTHTTIWGVSNLHRWVSFLRNLHFYWRIPHHAPLQTHH